VKGEVVECGGFEDSETLEESVDEHREVRLHEGTRRLAYLVQQID